MFGTILFLATLLTGASAAPPQLGGGGTGEPIEISGIKYLDFKRGVRTTGRDAPPVLQLRCRGQHCDGHSPLVVRCTNGAADFTAMWSCEAKGLDRRLRVADPVVSCEHWVGDNHWIDPTTIVQGSCGLEHRLELTGSSARAVR